MNTGNTHAFKQTRKTDKKNKLENVEQRISQLEKQERAIQDRGNEKKRKERTRRLIQIADIAIKNLDCESGIEPTDFETVIKLWIRGPDKKIQLENIFKI